MFRLCLSVIVLLFSTPVYACSYLLPKGPISQQLENREVFWGRATQTVWNKSDKGIPDPVIYTELEVLEVLQGELPKTVRVYHDKSRAACGEPVRLGDVSIFTIRKDDKGQYQFHYITDYMSPPLLAYAYFEHNKDYYIEDYVNAGKDKQSCRQKTPLLTCLDYETLKSYDLKFSQKADKFD